MLVPVRKWLLLAVASSVILIPFTARAQARQLQVCSQGPLLNCAGVRFTTVLGVGPLGTNLFQLSVQNLGSASSPTLATSIYFLSFLTGQPSAPEVNVSATPVAERGARLFDATDWGIYESGDAIFFSAPGNDGIGGCVGGSSINGFGLMSQTCGVNQFVTFNFFTPRAFDLRAISLAGMEFVALDNSNTADSCNPSMPCVVRDVAVVPEPATLLLVAAGLIGAACMGLRRRSRGSASAGFATGRLSAEGHST